MYEKVKIAYIENDPAETAEFIEKARPHFSTYIFENGFKFYDWLKKGEQVNAIVAAGKINSPNGLFLLKQIRESGMCEDIPFIMLVEKIDNKIRKDLMHERVSDCFVKKFDINDFAFRTKYLIENPSPVYLEKKVKAGKEHSTYQMPFTKRIFDIVFASFAILMLSPVYLIIALMIRITSKGPIFYTAKRVGTGYQIFDFYKFRSMKVGADLKLKEIAHLNQYKQNNQGNEDCECDTNDLKAAGNGKGWMSWLNAEKTMNVKDYIVCQYQELFGDNSVIDRCPDCIEKGIMCQSALVLDGNAVCEKKHLQDKKERDTGTFIKISNDPRVTNIGKFLRNTSLDELPQLFNVLKGDMSIVGNRPLPLYEAEKITTDQFMLRFLAPSGITGLWQVTKRGTSNMSEEERMQLDNDYAKNYSFWRDIKIILKTIPALLQKENV